MNMLKQKLTGMSELFNSRNDRERILIVSCLAVLIYTVWAFLFYDATSIAQSKLDVQVQNIQKKIKSIDLQHTVLLKTKRVDPDRVIKERISIAKQHLIKLDNQLLQKMKGLMLPTQMAVILEQVLTQQTKLKFIRLQSLETKPLLVATSDETGKINAINSVNTVNDDTSTVTDIGVYKHGIEMEFNGSYLETLQYLKKLEQLSWNFYWDAVLFDVQAYPQSKVIIRVHTLSLEEGWLGV